MSAAYRDERLALQASNGRLREQLLQQRQRIHAAAARSDELFAEQAVIDRQLEAAGGLNGASTQAEPFETPSSAPQWLSALGWVAGALVVFLASAWVAPVARATLLEPHSYRRVPSNTAPLRSTLDDNAGRHRRYDLDNLETAATYGVFPSGLVLEIWVSSPEGFRQVTLARPQVVAHEELVCARRADDGRMVEHRVMASMQDVKAVAGAALPVLREGSSKTDHEGDGVRVGVSLRGSRGETVALRRGADELQRLAAALDKCSPQPADKGADDSR